MGCMKCGTEIPEGQVFCDTCLANMERYPVKQGTPINLPNRNPDEKMPVKKLPPTPEQRLARAHLAIKWLAGLLAAALLLLSVTIAMLVHTARERDEQDNIGQNYSAISTQD